MKAIIFDGFSKPDSTREKICSLIIEQLHRIEIEAELIILRDKMVAACQGCFDCWLKTPGECKINDFGREAAKIMESGDLIIHLTPITFGGYSSELKKVVDRFIPTVRPYFIKRNGEIHHPFRSKKRGSIIVVGMLEHEDEEQESIFRQLVHRNSLNMGAPIHELIIYTKSQVPTAFTLNLAEIMEKVIDNHG